MRRTGVAGLPITEGQLRETLQDMKPRHKFFQILKEELSIKGYWRNLPRGNPAAGYKASRKESG